MVSENVVFLAGFAVPNFPLSRSRIARPRRIRPSRTSAS